MKLSQVLFSQGFGARRECAGLIHGGHVTLEGVVCDDPHREIEPEGLVFTVRGQTWGYHARALVLLNKPVGYECSQKPKHHPSVMSLLPAPLRVRGLQPVGRLDQDTTGLLLFTDDGTLIHRLTSPKKHVPKVYEINTAEPVTPAQIDELLRGVVLHDDPLPVRAAACEMSGPHALRMTLLEGKYHQVKRMIAATGNTVQSLHRSRYGLLEIPSKLGAGQWCWLNGPEVLFGASVASSE
jgi:16S rRNA pseudouridine516 synthase